MRENAPIGEDTKLAEALEEECGMLSEEDERGTEVSEDDAIAKLRRRCCILSPKQRDTDKAN